MLIANDKLKLDSFDRQYERRIAIYEATRSILEKVFRGNISEADTQVFGMRALDAQFLFDGNMYEYLRAVHQHVDAYRYVQSELNSQIPNDEREEYEQLSKKHMDWIIKQGDEKLGIGAKFAPFLVQKLDKRPLLLRWP